MLTSWKTLRIISCRQESECQPNFLRRCIPEIQNVSELFNVIQVDKKRLRLLFFPTNTLFFSLLLTPLSPFTQHTTQHPQHSIRHNGKGYLSSNAARYVLFLPQYRVYLTRVTLFKPTRRPNSLRLRRKSSRTYSLSMTPTRMAVSISLSSPRSLNPRTPMSRMRIWRLSSKVSTQTRTTAWTLTSF